jgi:hypothetical protein
MKTSWIAGASRATGRTFCCAGGKTFTPARPARRPKTTESVYQICTRWYNDWAFLREIASTGTWSRDRPSASQQSDTFRALGEGEPPERGTYGKMNMTEAVGLIELTPAAAGYHGAPGDLAQPAQDLRAETRSYVREVTALDGDPSGKPHPNVLGRVFSSSGRKFSRRGPTETGLHFIYTSVEAAGVVHFDL